MTVKHFAGTKAGKVLLSLLVLALLAVVLQPLVFSNASYTAARTSPANVFTAGTLAHTNSKAGQVVLDATNIRPGQTKTGTLTITGGGSLTGAYTLTKASLVDSPASPGLSNALTLQIQDVTSGSTSLYNGVAASFASVSLGTIAPGVVKTYQFSLTFPSGSANAALQGDSMTLTLQFKAVSP